RLASSALRSLLIAAGCGTRAPVRAGPQTSRLRTPSAFDSMNARRGSTCSPMSVEKISSEATASSIRTRRSPRAHRGFPQLCRIHLPQTLVTLDCDARARLGEQPVERFLERLDRLLLVTA